MRRIILSLMATLVLVIMVTSLMGNSTIKTDVGGCDETNPVFMIDMLSPNTNPERNSWSALMAEEFPKACIGVDTHLSTDWTTISSRTWAYGSSPIPSFDDGGFDMLSMGYPTDQAPVVKIDSYTTAQFPENGEFNFMHYFNSTLDGLNAQYLQEVDPEVRQQYAYQIQKILYEDQPTLTIVYEQFMWLYAAIYLHQSTKMWQ